MPIKESFISTDMTVGAFRAAFKNQIKDIQMKKYFLSLILVASFLSVTAQVPTQKTSSNMIYKNIKLTNKSNIDVLTMPAFDKEKLLAEDETDKDLGLPYRFGYAHYVDYDMHNAGTWTETEEGRIWSLKIVSKGAFSINLAYSNFYLPENSQMFVYNETKTVLLGPITS